MLKKISLLLCAFTVVLGTYSHAAPYVQINGALSPSTSLTKVDTGITNKDVYNGMSFGIEAILGTQGRLFAYEAAVAYTSNPTHNNVESSILDYKLSALLAPKVGLGMMAIIPYIGPQIGYSSYSHKYNSVSESRGAFLYGAKAGIKLPIALLYLDLGASYLMRRGQIHSTDTQISDNLNVFLGVGFRLF